MNDYNLDEIINAIQNKKWRQRGKWYHTVIFNEIFTVGESTASCERLGYPFKKTQAIWLQNGDFLDLEDEWQGMRGVVEQGYLSDKNYLHNYANHCLKLGEEVIEFSQALKQLNCSNLSDADLVGHYKSLIQKCQDFIPFMMSLHMVDEYLTERFDFLLNKFITEKGLTKKDFFEYQTALTLPFRKIFVLAEKEDLMKLALHIKRENLSVDSEVVQKDIDTHTAAYSWSNAVLLEHLPFTTQYFKEKLQSLLATDVEAEYQSIQDNETRLRQQQAECMEQIKNFEDLFAIAETVQIFGFLRSYRVDVIFVAYINCWNIVSELSQRLGIDVRDSVFLDSEEVEGALIRKHEGYQDLILDRRKGFISVFINGHRYELTHQDSESLVQHIKLPEVELTSSVKGATAYPGKITGTCKVLHTLDDMKKVERGDIIIISMTDPKYIPAMDRAAAFVTDQGGILCHAAIVSREMKKPCVIGTKVGTKTFKDGDMVEVDADKGEVHILNRIGDSKDN